jgi:hypothetical protein
VEGNVQGNRTGRFTPNVTGGTIVQDDLWGACLNFGDGPNLRVAHGDLQIEMPPLGAAGDTISLA